MTPKINIHLRDGFAEAYAFATLCKYLFENGFKERIEVVYSHIDQANIFSKRVGKTPSGVEPFEFLNYNDFKDSEEGIHLGGYSDVRGSASSNIQIDLSILKNCVEPLSEEERKKLREANEISL